MLFSSMDFIVEYSKKELNFCVLVYQGPESREFTAY